jgi:DNA invertase Pin-like site-specific DNA recombinase
MKDRAIAIGWPQARVKTIDEDLGHSGTSTAGRDGFQKLVAEVSLGHVGLVIGLEVSRLARNDADWHRLLEICAINNTLIMDEDGLYDPNDFNDRIVLGMKGIMSEAELHFIRSRLRGGALNKARRGELRISLPIGFVYSEDGKPILDPDRQVQDTLRLFFRTYARLGSAHATVQEFHRKGIPFPRRPRAGPHKGELLWAPAHYVNALLMLRNPRYAGAYVFGRWRRHTGPRRRTQVLKPREEWEVFLPGSHPGYISWEEYERNLRQLHATAQASGVFQRQGPPREGPALLQGLALCGLCGYRMQIHYRKGNATMSPVYCCRQPTLGGDTRSPKGHHPYLSIPGEAIDMTVGKVLIEVMTPLSLEKVLEVQKEIENRLGEEDRLRHQAIERAQYQADLARARFMRLDPNNRLVGANLEADWNGKLRDLAQLTEDYEKWKKEGRRGFTDEERGRVRSLATEFATVWNHPKTTPQERKRMARLLIEDVTLLKGETTTTVHLRLKGGATHTLSVPHYPKGWEKRRTNPLVVEVVRSLSLDHTDTEIATLLNQQGFRPIKRVDFLPSTVNTLRHAFGIQGQCDALLAKGMLTSPEVGRRLGVGESQVYRLRKQGKLQGMRPNGKVYLYDPHSVDLLLSQRQRARSVIDTDHRVASSGEDRLPALR